MRKFYNIFIRGKILIYLLIIFSYFGVRVFLAHSRWSDEETAVMQKLALYKQQRHWAWGVEHFPYMVKQFAEHPQLPFGKKAT